MKVLEGRERELKEHFANHAVPFRVVTADDEESLMCMDMTQIPHALRSEFDETGLFVGTTVDETAAAVETAEPQETTVEPLSIDEAVAQTIAQNPSTEAPASQE